MPIVDEIQAYFGSDLCKLAPIIYNPIGDISEPESQQLKQWILQAMDIDPSHSVTGVYTIGNMISRPHKYYAIIGSLEQGGLLLNVDPDRNWMIVINNRANSTHLEELQGLLKYLSTVFLFTAGNEIIGLADNLYANDYFSRTLHNNVYGLTSFHEELGGDCNNIAKTIIHPTTQDNFLKVKQFYGYKEDHMTELSNTQVVLELDDELVAGARTNEEVDSYCVIGGVKTVPQKRKQKLGFTVCYQLIDELHQKFDNIVLETDVDNFPAIKIYERLGFQKIGDSAFFEKGLDMIAEVIGHRDY